LKEEHGLRIEQPKGRRVSSDTAAEISDQIKKCMRDLINEILHSLDYYSSQKGKKIKKIFISGGSAYLNNVSGFLSGALGLPVERHNPFARIDHNPHRFSPDYLEKEGSFFAVGSGLALREVARI
jgi:Tfp pilus assembly PilM family ATPase